MVKKYEIGQNDLKFILKASLDVKEAKNALEATHRRFRAIFVEGSDFCHKNSKKI